MNATKKIRRSERRSGTRMRFALGGAAACIALLSALPAQAQSTGFMGRNSMIPYTSSGYVGANGGVSDYRGGCAAGFGCDDSDRAFKIYTGGMFNQWIGAELGYHHFGTVDRNGGSTRAHGINLSLVGNFPIGDQFMVYGKLGTTYGRTRNTSTVGAFSGTGNGWGGSWGFGAGFNLTPQWAIVLDWDQHRFEFPTGKDYVSATTLGVRLKF